MERELSDADGILRRYRATSRIPVDGEGPTPEELGRMLRSLAEELDRALPAGVPPTARPERSLTELVETYRPRQPELVDLLLEEGELTEGESQQLRRYLTDRSLPTEPVVTDRPIAAAPLAQDRAPARPRSIAELLRTYQIESLKQAGAVRARRQISFEEYMELKRHFAATEPPSPAPSAP